MIRRQTKECLDFVHAVSGAGFNTGSDIGEAFCWMLQICGIFFCIMRVGEGIAEANAIRNRREEGPMNKISQYSGRYNQLTRQMLGYCLAEGENVMISPLSVLLLLSVAADATTDNTREEILKVLGDTTGRNHPGPALQSFRKTLIANREFSSAVAACVRQDFAGRINRTFTDWMLKPYGGRLFSSGYMKQDLNAWIATKTNGMIRDAAPENADKMLLFLMNATAFEAAWRDPVEDEDVKDGWFRNADGTAGRVNMLHGSETIFLEDRNFTGFTREYAGGIGFSFMALLPKQEGSAALQSAVEQTVFTNLYRSGRRAIVETVMPEFSFEYSRELRPLCKALGMKEIFTDQADFSPICLDPLTMTSIQHKTLIEVNRHGTRAAAATMGEMILGCLPPEETKKVILDRPFVFAIVHDGTGLPVFTGAVNHLKETKAGPEKDPECRRQGCSSFWTV